MGTKTVVKHQCIGERRYGAFQFAPPGWHRCQNEADYLLDIKGAGGEEGYACDGCFKELLAQNPSVKIIKSFVRKRA